MSAKFRILFGIQFAFLILAVIATLLIGSDSEFVLLFGLPPLLISALLLLMLVIMALFARQFRLLLKILVANLIAVLIGTAAIFFTGRGYAFYMHKSESDTIPYQLIQSKTIQPDCLQAFVVHESLYKRKHMFSSVYVLLKYDEWQSYHNGWIDFYRLVVEQKAKNEDMRDANKPSLGEFTIIGMPRDSIFYMGVGTTKQVFDYRDGLIPGDTIMLTCTSQSCNSDTIKLVKSN